MKRRFLSDCKHRPSRFHLILSSNRDQETRYLFSAYGSDTNVLLALVIFLTFFLSLVLITFQFAARKVNQHSLIFFDELAFHLQSNRQMSVFLLIQNQYVLVHR